MLLAQHNYQTLILPHTHHWVDDPYTWFRFCRVQHHEAIRKLGHHAQHRSELKERIWASLVAQWLRIRLLMQGTRVQALLWEDPTCRGATKPVRHNY